MSTTYIFNEKMNNKIDSIQFRVRLTEILRETVINDPNSKAQQFTDEVYRQIHNLSKNGKFVAGLIKGSIHEKIINIDDFFVKINISVNQNQKEAIHNLIQLALANELNEYMMFQYITQNLPLMSFLKRELLNIRPGTDIPQWQFIAEKCFVKANTTNELKAVFSKIANYKQISDQLCARVVSALVKSMTGKRFDTIISQKGKGWYPNGLEELPEKLYNVNPHHLFLIAYSFKMNLKKYDEMILRNENIYDCFCYEENMFRFLLSYIRTIDEFYYFMEFIAEHRKDFLKSENSEYNAGYVTKEINSFFHNNKGDISSLCHDFINLLKKLGVTSAENREKILNLQRKQIAGRYMQQLLNDINLTNITIYFSLLNNTVDDIISFKYEKNTEKIDKATKILQNNYTQLMEKTSENEKAKILSMLCDRFAPESSSYIRASIRPILKSRFTTEHIGKISKRTTTDPITRTDILKMGYLRTFIDFINKNNNRFRNKSEMTTAIKELTDIFEENTNKMLKDCCFVPVHITFPLDGLICIALSSGINDRCIPEVFQACLPIDMTRRTEEI